MMKTKTQNLLTLFSIILIGFNSTIYAQCPQEQELASKYRKMADGADSWDVATPASLCSKYYKLVCDAKQDFYSVNNQTINRSKQEALLIEDEIREIINSYNESSNKVCEELKHVKAIYKDSIGIKQENVVGYWVAKDYNKYYDKINYPIFAFFNDGNFKTSQTSSFKQKSSWKKTAENEYLITISDYRDSDKTWSTPRTNTFVINTQTNTATYSFTNYNGEKNSSTWYYKGKTYSHYKKNENEILSTASVTTK